MPALVVDVVLSERSSVVMGLKKEGEYTPATAPPPFPVHGVTHWRIPFVVLNLQINPLLTHQFHHRRSDRGPCR